MPTRSQYGRIALYICGNQFSTVGYVVAKQAIAQQTTKFPNTLSPTIIDPICKHTSKAAHFVEWELYTQTQPGHFYNRNIRDTRASLHKQGFAPEVRLSGLGQIKALTWNVCVIHAIPKDAEVCLKFLDELTKARSHDVRYRGESMAAFNQRVFDE